MDHINRGLYRIFESPLVFDLFETILGARSVLRRYTAEYIRPFETAKILDIGCGPGAIVEYLPKSSSYFGYDMNPWYIDFAKKKYGNRGAFACSRISDSSPHPLAGHFDFVLATSVLHHLYDTKAQQMIQSAYSHLKKGGVFLTLDCVYIPNQSKIARFIISKDRGRQIRTPGGYQGLLGDRFSLVETFIIHDMFNFPFTHFVMRATK